MSLLRIDALDKNHIINGNFDHWQRALSQTTANSSYGSVDRWRPSVFLITGVGTISKSNNVPNNKSSSSMRFEVNTAQASIGNDKVRVLQFIEGLILRSAIGDNSSGFLTASFQFRTNKAGTYSFVIQNALAARSYTSQFVVSSSEAAGQSWVKRTIQIPLENSSWTIDTNRALTVSLSLADGDSAALASATNTWLNGTHSWASGQVNLMDTIGNYVEISQAMLVRGKIDDPVFLDSRNPVDELYLCKRYYNKVQIRGSAPMTSTTEARITLDEATRMRAYPTIASGLSFHVHQDPSVGTGVTYDDHANWTASIDTGNRISLTRSIALASRSTLSFNDGCYIALNAEL